MPFRFIDLPPWATVLAGREGGSFQLRPVPGVRRRERARSDRAAVGVPPADEQGRVVQLTRGEDVVAESREVRRGELHHEVLVLERHEIRAAGGSEVARRGWDSDASLWTLPRPHLLE